MRIKNFVNISILACFIFSFSSGMVTAQTPKPPDVFQNKYELSKRISDKYLIKPPNASIESLGGDWIVDTLADEDSDGECATDCTLREAIELASPGDTIIFDDAIAGGTITFNGESWENLRIYIEKDLTIDNSNHTSKITIDGDNTWGIFRVNYGIEFTLNNIALENGTGTGAGIYNDGGIVTLYGCSFNDNGSVSTSGGAIYNTNQVFIDRTHFSNNSANNGGALYNTHELEIYDSFFENNLAANRGGAIYNSLGSAVDMNLIVDGCTFSGNSVTNYDGGAIYNDSHGLMTVTNCTFYDNTASRGGGIFSDTSDKDQLIVNSTFSNNTADSGAGGGIHTFGFMRLYNSILANSAGGAADCYQNIAGTNWFYHNLIETDSGSPYACYDLSNISGDPDLGALQDNGGNTYTMALGASSPAIDAGGSGTDPNGYAHFTTTDQRGVERPQGSDYDIGAFEAEVAPVVLSITRVNNNPTDANFVNFEVTFSSAVDGVNSTDFNVNTTGVSGAAYSAKSGSDGDSTYTITISTGTGIGTIGLNLYDNDSITSTAGGIPLGGAGVGNGSFTDGEIYTIDSPPSFRSHPVENVNLNNLYTYDIETQDPDLPSGDTLTISTKTLPSWLSLINIDTANGTATLTGTPGKGDEGSYLIRLLVKDSLNLSETQEFTLVVNRPPKFTSSAVTAATLGETYTYNITAVDSDGDHLTITAPTKPSWLTITDYGNGTALLTGSPVSVGGNSVILRVSDGNAFVEQSFSITVSEPEEFLIFVPMVLR